MLMLARSVAYNELHEYREGISSGIMSCKSTKKFNNLGYMLMLIRSVATVAYNELH